MESECAVAKSEKRLLTSSSISRSFIFLDMMSGEGRKNRFGGIFTVVVFICSIIASTFFILFYPVQTMNSSILVSDNSFNYSFCIHHSFADCISDYPEFIIMENNSVVCFQTLINQESKIASIVLKPGIGEFGIYPSVETSEINTITNITSPYIVYLKIAYPGTSTTLVLSRILDFQSSGILYESEYIPQRAPVKYITIWRFENMCTLPTIIDSHLNNVTTINIKSAGHTIIMYKATFDNIWTTVFKVGWSISCTFLIGRFGFRCIYSKNKVSEPNISDIDVAIFNIANSPNCELVNGVTTKESHDAINMEEYVMSEVEECYSKEEK